MTILATRFKTLDREFNVPTADMSSLGGSDVLNSTLNSIPELKAGDMSFFEKGIQAPKVELTKLKDELVRDAKGALGSLKDLAKFSPKQLDEAISDMLPDNPLAQSAFNLMSSKCKTKGMSRFNLGKPYDPSINCGGRKKKAANKSGGCNAGQFSNVLNKLTKGAYNGGFNDLNRALRNLVNLSNFGYSMNMCGVFSALSGTAGLNKNILSRATGSLLGSLGASKNILGFFDLANSAPGLHTVKENPNGLSSVFKNMTVPNEVKQSGLANFNDRLMGSMELFDPTWDKSRHDGLLSSAIVPVQNDALGLSLRGKMMSERISVADLSIPKRSPINMMAMANKASKFGSPMLAKFA